jgi:WD40 repeat protein
VVSGSRGRSLGRRPPGACPDSRTLATACVEVSSPTEFDEAIFLWDLETVEQIKKVGVPDAAITAMDFSSDGQRLVTATEMGTALVWPVH